MLDLSRRDLFLASAGGLAAASLATAATAADPVVGAPGKTTLSPDQALARLKDGNRRFVNDVPNASDLSRKGRLAVAKGQGPFAALVGCADSRVGPEHLFGAGLGELFIVRTAGNYVDTAGLGSLEYAVGVLGVPLIVVLGHERCGAVAAAVDVVKKNAQLPGSIGLMVNPILPAVVEAERSMQPGEVLVDASIRTNVLRVAKRLRTYTEPLLLDPIKAGKLKIVGATYDLDTGAVAFLDG